MSKRQSWIDVLRGVTMILVVAEHCMGYDVQVLAYTILCFHMPLFYFISGLTFSPSKYGTYKNGLKSKAIGIGLQYICFEIIGLIAFFILQSIGIQDYGSKTGFLSSLIGIFFPDGQIGKNVTMGFWFVYDIIVINWIGLTIYYCSKLLEVFKTKA